MSWSRFGRRSRTTSVDGDGASDYARYERSRAGSEDPFSRDCGPWFRAQSRSRSERLELCKVVFLLEKSYRAR